MFEYLPVYLIPLPDSSIPVVRGEHVSNCLTVSMASTQQDRDVLGGMVFLCSER